MNSFESLGSGANDDIPTHSGKTTTVNLHAENRNEQTHFPSLTEVTDFKNKKHKFFL